MPRNSNGDRHARRQSQRSANEEDRIVELVVVDGKVVPDTGPGVVK